jgi:hypothetical protein
MAMTRLILRLVRSAPEQAIEKILAAYDAGDGWPEVAARKLHVAPRTLRKYVRRLGIVALIQCRSGHYPGWLGRRSWDFRPVRGGVK